MHTSSDKGSLLIPHNSIHSSLEGEIGDLYMLDSFEYEVFTVQPQSRLFIPSHRQASLAHASQAAIDCRSETLTTFHFLLCMRIIQKNSLHYLEWGQDAMLSGTFALLRGARRFNPCYLHGTPRLSRESYSRIHRSCDAWTIRERIASSRPVLRLVMGRGRPSITD